MPDPTDETPPTPLTDAILRADAAEQDKIRMSGLLGDQTLQADRYREGLEQMSRIVCTCPSPNNRGIPTNTVPCPTHSSGRFARHLLNPKEES
jgi:hypothetical protein